MQTLIEYKIVRLINRLNIVPTLYYIPSMSEDRPGFISLSPDRDSNVLNRVALFNYSFYPGYSLKISSFFIIFHTFDYMSILTTPEQVEYSTKYLELIYTLQKLFRGTSHKYVCSIRISEIPELEKTIDELMECSDEELKLYFKLSS